MSNLVPTKAFLTKGLGQHKYKLKSFEALRKAGMVKQNSMQVSWILPMR